MWDVTASVACRTLWSINHPSSTSLKSCGTQHKTYVGVALTSSVLKYNKCLEHILSVMCIRPGEFKVTAYQSYIAWGWNRSLKQAVFI
uniref:Uncharacterized protein n=1 Tax=Anguilla anguilla TaxID=7936 RepID=A0A0E9SCH8_ANGAN